MRSVSSSVAIAFLCGVVGCGTSSAAGSGGGGVEGDAALDGTSGDVAGSSDSTSGIGDGTGSDTTLVVDSAPGANATVSVFDKALFAFSSTSNTRRQTAPAAFPSGGTFQNITLTVELSCPTGGCDIYDRAGSLGIVTQAAVDGGTSGTVVEIARFITPFGIAAPAWTYDVTDLAPLLTGNATIQGFIDTWSPQGDAAQNGAGWLLTATFAFTGGTPAKVPIANIPVWSWSADGDPSNAAQYGDPTDPISNHVTPQELSLVGGASSYTLRTFVTGHGQGNTDNCGEFCPSTHTLTVGATAFTQAPWRTCCTPQPSCEDADPTTVAQEPTPGPGVTPGQLGTSWLSRAGWCPGAAVEPWSQDVTQAMGTGATQTLSYGVDSYVNGCRPDSDAGTCDDTQCAYCQFNSPTSCKGTTADCSFNGGEHTEPFFYISGLLIAYR